MNTMLEITPSRSFNLTYIILDSIFIIFFIGLLILKKNYITCLFSCAGGILYFIVDFGLFYLASHSRSIYIDGALQGDLNTALVLLRMSLSYGITNFAFIWLCLKKDKNLVLWLTLIIGWWIAAPSLSMFGGAPNIFTYRTTGSYHWIMSLFLVVGYGGLIVYALFKKQKIFNILTLNLIGISVQFGWEFALLINGIRPMNDSSIATILINSLIETNMGMPYIFLIYYFISKFYNDDFSKFEAKKVPEEI
ncbi:MAG: hypothetical protein RSB95_00395 [Bacilli bacterium]